MERVYFNESELNSVTYEIFNIMTDKGYVFYKNDGVYYFGVDAESKPLVIGDEIDLETFLLTFDVTGDSEKEETEPYTLMTIEDIVNYIIPDKFGRTLYFHQTPQGNIPVYVSNGIMYAYSLDPETWREYLLKAMEQYERRDYGGFYEPGEIPMPGHDYFQCKSPLGKDLYESIIIHEEKGGLVFYFQFER